MLITLKSPCKQIVQYVYTEYTCIINNIILIINKTVCILSCQC